MPSPPVALKFCFDSSAKDSLLRHEAAILNQVMRQGRHPGIVALQHTYLSADSPCLEYEYVAGGDLGGLLQDWRRNPPGTDRVGRLILELTRIVAFAHRLSPPIVHRDLKPANILVQPAPDGGFTLRVADFGIGGVAANRALAASARGVSRGQFLVTALRGAHTPLYASPQQMRGEPPDPRDDVYSLGVIWYQILTGSLIAGRPGGTRWTGRLSAAGVPQGQVDLLSACLEDEPADRPADAGILADRLGTLLDRPAALPASLPAVADSASGATCPDCGGAMKVRMNKHGGSFLGCAAFPSCRGTRPLPRELVDPLMAAGRVRPLIELPAQIVNSVGMHFALVPAGTFRMGSPNDELSRSDDEGPVRLVRIDRPFYLGIHPVTQKQYQAVTGDNPAHFHKQNGGGPDHPVEQVSWDDAVAFARQLSGRPDEKKAGRVYRLPSEAEWEYACRAGTQTPFSTGDDLSSFEANFDGNRPGGAARPGPFLSRTTPVASFPTNAWGLFDMHGNVWEWCADWYTRGRHRSVRGGSWNNSGHLCRSARRQKYAPDFRADSVGFRLVLEVGD